MADEGSMAQQNHLGHEPDEKHRSDRGQGQGHTQITFLLFGCHGFL
jgi:hypothetical protein